MICGCCGKHFEFHDVRSSCRTKGCPAYGLTYKQVDLSAFYAPIRSVQPAVYFGA